MDINIIERIAMSQSIWAIIAMIFAYVVYKLTKSHISSLNKKIEVLNNDSKDRENKLISLYEKQKLESNERENRLMNHLDKTAETLLNVDKSLSKLHSKVDDGFKEVWDHLKSNLRG